MVEIGECFDNPRNVPKREVKRGDSQLISSRNLEIRMNYD